MEKKLPSDIESVRKDIKLLVSISRHLANVCEKQKEIIRKLKQQVVLLKQENSLLQKRSENVVLE